MFRRAICNSRQRLLAAIACGYCLTAPVLAHASASRILDNDPDVSTLSQYGGIGLLDTRSARFMPDGYFSATAYIGEPDIRSALTFQALPWMEVTFRYTVDNAIKDIGGRSLHDRSFDIKIRLHEETDTWPAFALGLQDFLGTGVYSGEYLVASKRVGDFDFSAGLGWGRLASRGTFKNPLIYLYSGFGTRPQAFQGNGGVPLLNSYFRGPNMGIFGGLEYRTPIRDLSLILEYSSDAYSGESHNTGIDYSFPVNVGLNYRPWPGFDVGISYMHGNTVSFHVDAFFDPGEDHTRDRLDQPPPIVARDPTQVEELRRDEMLEQPAQKNAPKTQFVDLTQTSSKHAPAKDQRVSDNAPAPKHVLVISESGASTRVADETTTPKQVPGMQFVDLTQSGVAQTDTSATDHSQIAQNSQPVDTTISSDAPTMQKPVVVQTAANVLAPGKTQFVDLTQNTQVASTTAPISSAPKTQFVDLTQDTQVARATPPASSAPKTRVVDLTQDTQVASATPPASKAPKTQYVDLTRDTQIATNASQRSDVARNITPARSDRLQQVAAIDTAPSQTRDTFLVISETGSVQKLTELRPASTDSPASRMADASVQDALNNRNLDRVLLTSNEAFLTVAQRNVAFEQASETEQPGPAIAVSAPSSMASAVEAQSLEVDGIEVHGNRMRIIITNNRYLRDAEAIARTARALSATAPAEIEYFQIVTSRDDMPLTSVLLSRTQLDALARHDAAPVSLFQSAVLDPADPSLQDSYQKSYPRFESDYIFPTFQQSFFDPDQPYYVRIGVGTDFALTLLPGLVIEGAADAALFDSVSQNGGLGSSVLPHVRTDIAEYRKQGKYGIGDLEASYSFKMTPELYARIAAGYLEDMYAGAGGEVLYRPWGKRWAVGLDVWAVQQRDFNRLLGLRDYQVVTGQATLYYKLPWHDVDAKVRVGRFLAGDYGANFEVVRHFSTGMEVGAWATFTNVSSANFGEGSFDKGIIIRIPLEWVAPFPSRGVYNVELRSIQRDGGQRLNNVQRLYDATDPSDYGEIAEQWDSVFE